MSDPHSAKSAVATPRTEWLDPRPDENVLSRTSLCATLELLRWHYSQTFAVLSKMVLLLSMACIVTPKEGMAIARAKGKLRGRQPKLSEKQQKDLMRMHAIGDYSISDLASDPIIEVDILVRCH